MEPKLAESTPFAAIVEASGQVASTRSRRSKIATIAALLQALSTDDLAATIGFLTGEPRQGKIGIGWATISEIDAEPSPTPSLTVREIDDALLVLQATTGGQSVAARRTTLRALFARATEAETDFLRRLLIGELRQGALDGIMAEAIASAYDVAPDSVRRAAMLTGLLGRAATLARDGGQDALGAVRLTVFQPVLPMLAGSSPSAAEAIAACGLSSVEYKLDGARIQVHRSGDAVEVFTRNLNNVTARLPEVVAAALAVDAQRFIVDGEVLGFFDDDRPQAFQDTISNFSSESPVSRSTLVPYFFDCLHVDGTDYLDRPLHERSAMLERIAPARCVPRVVTDDPGVAQSFLDDAIAAGHEGVMVKGIDSLYDAGRRGQSWRKVKPVHTRDLVVLAAEWGHGRRHGWLSNLHLGALAADGTFVMVGKTFKGLTDALLKSQTDALLDREVRREGIVVFVRPELVVEIALDGVQASKRYPGGVALRFARVRRYRADKSASEADTIESLRDLLPH
ncbi:MAG: ATP-dependent DNA ligase [Acidimicrobiales bacterium]